MITHSRQNSIITMQSVERQQKIVCFEWGVGWWPLVCVPLEPVNWINFYKSVVPKQYATFSCMIACCPKGDWMLPFQWCYILVEQNSEIDIAILFSPLHSSKQLWDATLWHHLMTHWDFQHASTHSQSSTRYTGLATPDWQSMRILNSYWTKTI